jgi:hypothetical protein
MKINDATDIPNSLYHDALWLVDADSNVFPVEAFMRSANFALDYVVRKILTVSGRWQYDDTNNDTVPVDRTPLIGGQNQYVLADKHLRVLRVRVKDTNGTYRTLKPKDDRDMSDDDLSKVGTPEYYDKVGRSIFLYPSPDYSADAGVEISFQMGSNYFSTADTTKEPGFDSIFHRYVSLIPAREYAMKYAQQYLNLIDTEIQRLDKDLLEHYATRDVDDAPFLSTERTTEIY